MSSYLINIGFRQNIEEEKYMSQSEKTVGFCKRIQRVIPVSGLV